MAEGGHNVSDPLDDCNELESNYYFMNLKDEYKEKYQRAIENGYTICVPLDDNMVNCEVTGYFVDQHILRPTKSPIYFISTYPREQFLHKIEKRLIKFIGRAKYYPIDEQEPPAVDEKETLEDDIKYNFDAETDVSLTRILSVEKGYNDQNQPYNILVVEHPILHSYRDEPDDDIILTASVEDYRTATEYLEILSERKTFSMSEAENMISHLVAHPYENEQDMKNVIKSCIQSNWARIVRKNPPEHQRDERFQKRTSLALEMYVLRGLHQIIYNKISEDFKEHNSHLKDKIDALNAAGATPDQLGVREDFAIMLAYGVVELARLCATIGPHARLNLLSSSLEMAIAEIKGALAESVAKSDDIDDEATLDMTITPGDLIQICTYLIVKCRCYTLYQDIYYIENYVFSLNPADKKGYILTVYKSALENVEKIDTNNLPTRSEKVKTEMSLEDLLEFDMESPPRELSPLDIQLKKLKSIMKIQSSIFKKNYHESSSSEEDS